MSRTPPCGSKATSSRRISASYAARIFEIPVRGLAEKFGQLDRQRPVIGLDDPDHELARAQQVGIMPERLLELYATHGHAPG